MKILVALATLLGCALSASSAVMKDSPVQTFFVPVPEYEALNQAFVPTNHKSISPVVSIVSFSVSINGTVIWYDHWEDGYDADVTNLGTISPTTVVWGDGNITNGCAPGTPCDKDSDDLLVSGQSIVIENEVHVLSDRTSMLSPPVVFDARDRVQASFYIAITRGGYPYKPGAYLAGAVEVLDTAHWGTEFEAPVGTLLHADSDKTRAEAYELTYMYVMAGEDDTRVTMPNGTKIDLDMGGSVGIKVDQGDVVLSTKNIQADIIAMDLQSTHEIRWYSLVATKFWSSKYMTPMGDSKTASTARIHAVLRSILL